MKPEQKLVVPKNSEHLSYFPSHLSKEAQFLRFFGLPLCL